MTKSNLNGTTNEIQICKKGRKPKGGKLTLLPCDKIEKYSQVTNIILHLKCNLVDLDILNSNSIKYIKDPLEYDPTVPNVIQSYSDNDVFTSYQNIEPEGNNIDGGNEILQVPESIIQELDIYEKLKKIKINLYKNCVDNKKPDCFWCTYPFNTPSCYIPKYEMDGNMFGYGAFCRPECAVAFLMKENIDDSTKFERYHLLNNVYGKVYDHNKNIKPAPNPHYLLDKYYGSLTIQEYRNLLKTEHYLQVIEKPMTRILPEIHDDNEDNIEHFYGTDNTNSKNMGMYKVKRKTERSSGPSKNLIMREHFGLL